MNRTLLALVSAVLLVTPLWAVQETSQTSQTQDTKQVSLEEQLKKNPDNISALNAYAGENLRKVIPLIGSDPQKAEDILSTMRQFLGTLEPTSKEAKPFVARILATLDMYERQIQLARTTLEELEAKLKTNPDDATAISLYVAKVSQVLSPLASSEPEKADEQLKAAEKFLEEIKTKVQSEPARQALARVESSFERLKSSIERGMRLAALIGADMAPMEIETWVNGEPLTDAQLKGKVVLLDFWAIWCGPCIATFPHLREWQEKYADKGLVMIGLTRYYNYAWDTEAGRPNRSKDSVSPEQEQDMLVKFAEHHQLHHRFAIQKDRGLSDYYAVTGIPHVVLIDQYGKVRLIRVGSGEKNARDIEEMLAKLIAEAK